jgi:hypothetical protein
MVVIAVILFSSVGRMAILGSLTALIFPHYVR